MFQYIHDIINNIVLEQSLNDKNLNSVFNKMISKQIMQKNKINYDQKGMKKENEKKSSKKR